MNEEWIDQFIGAVKKLAFDMPAPNAYTPQFVQLCLAAEQLRAEEKHRSEAIRWKEFRYGMLEQGPARMAAIEAMKAEHLASPIQDDQEKER